MSKRIKWLLAAVIALLLGVTYWQIQGPAVAAVRQDERPPIVIYEGSIHFNFGGGWSKHATQGWYSADLSSDPNGPKVSQFDALAIATTATTKSVHVLTGTQLTITYAEGNQTHQFTLEIDPSGAAVLKPPAQTQLKSARRWNLRAGNTSLGAITSAAAGGRTYKFSPAEDVRIVVKLKP